MFCLLLRKDTHKMNRLLYIIVAFALLLTGCGGSNKQGGAVAGDNAAKTAASNGAIIAFEDTAADLGTFTMNDGDQQHTFHYRNTGKKPLVITKVETSCHCLTAMATKHPVAPGDTGSVLVIYKASESKPEKFMRTATVYTNGTPARQLLTVTGEVVYRP